MLRLKLLWSPDALAGIRRLYYFLADKNPTAARAAMGVIRKHAAVLKKFPQAGRPADDLEPEHRELLIPFGASGYVLIYEVEAGHVLVLAVRHQKEAGY